MENFVRDYGTGSQIPDPPVFVDYSNPNTIPSSGQQITTRPATFVRATQRTRQAPPSPPPPQEEEPPINMTGVGRAGGKHNDLPDGAPHRQDSRDSTASREPLYVNGHSVSPGPTQPSRGQQARPHDPSADPIDPTAETRLKIGDRDYAVDPSRDPQRGNTVAAPRPLNVGHDDDPLARQMMELQKAGSTRRQSQYQPPYPSSSASPTKPDATANKLSPPPDGSSRSTRRNSVDYRRSAEIVVGAPPPQSTSRSASPNPYPKHMLPPSQANAGPSGNLPVENILHDYEQSFPGERKSISRPGSRPGSTIGLPGHGPSPSQSQIQTTRPLSGQAGIGAQGRSPSPQPFAPPSRRTSPAMQPQPTASRRLSTGRVPPPSVNGAPPGHHPTASVSSLRSGNIEVPQQAAHHQRPTSPNTVGITLDPTGRVAVDEMANRYQPASQQQQQQQQQQYGRPPQQQPQATPGQGQRQPYGAPGYTQQPPAGHIQQPGPPVPYGAPPPTVAAPTYGAPNYGQPPPPQPSMYTAPPAPQMQYQPPHQQQPSYSQPNGFQNSLVPTQPRTSTGYYSHQDPYAQQPQQPQQYRAPSPARAPSPQPPPQGQAPPPTGAYTEDGRGILFYGELTFSFLRVGVRYSPPGLVKAMYDYQATIEEEFDFQAGDIIAVTATPEDGWWSGELLDEQRRQHGRHVFPSNFVCLF